VTFEKEPLMRQPFSEICPACWGRQIDEPENFNECLVSRQPICLHVFDSHLGGCDPCQTEARHRMLSDGWDTKPAMLFA